MPKVQFIESVMGTGITIPRGTITELSHAEAERYLRDRYIVILGQDNIPDEVPEVKKVQSRPVRKK